ncbi:MAG TPA: hypothetical protein VG407_17940 [Caulobacteraceae bacterium]|jgi:hypothetical protein|nr:hypothetical protein [Caulobacteraceae bacterium]
MLIEIACNALRQGKVLELNYGGFSRVFEVHTVGWSSTGHAVARAWQVGGGAQRGERPGWKLVLLDDAKAAQLTTVASQAPRRGYRRGDRAVHRIVYEF